MNHVGFLWARMLLFVAAAMLFSGCGCGDDDDDSDNAADDDVADDDTDDDVDDDTTDDDIDDDTDDDTTDDDIDDDADPGDPIEPSDAFLDRCAEYISNCYDISGPGSGRTYGQICRLELGGEIDADAIVNSLIDVNNREDTSDFRMTAYMRLLYLYTDSPDLPSAVYDDLKDAFLNFKYWMDEGGPDDMVFWSENHEILFLQLGFLAGQLWPDETFTNSGMTGEELMEKTRPRLLEWMKWRSLFGFTEWHSNVYFNEDVPPLTNLADFAEDEEIAAKASMIMDLLAFDMALNSYKGYLVAPHGRTYPDKVTGRGSDSMRPAQYVLFGQGDGNTGDNFSAIHLCTATRYALPPVLEEIGGAQHDAFINRQRDGINIEDGPDWGLTYDDPEHVTFWWSMGAYADWRIAPGTLQTVEDWDMWGGWLWSDIDFLRPLVGSPLVPLITKLIEPISSGSALEEMHTYTFRTPDYHVSSAQDHKKGYWGAQQNVWSAILDKDAVVFTTYPGGIDGDYLGTDWTGGWLPRLAQYENVVVAVYDRPWLPLDDYSHAYFPKAAFDEWEQSGNWFFGRKGDGYVALHSMTAPIWADPPNDGFELQAHGYENVWVLEMGRSATDGSFADFKTAIENADISFNGLNVEYDSPSVGTVEFGWTGDFVVDGNVVDLADFARFDNDYCRHEVGDDPYTIESDAGRLELDFTNARRRFFAADGD